MPAGVVNVVHGGGERRRRAARPAPGRPRDHAHRLARDRRRACMKAAADELKHVHLELGGKNAIIVLDDADLDLAVEGIIWSAFGTSGQRCTAASRVIVHEQVYGALQSKLVAAAEKMRLGPGWEPDTDVGPVINQRGAREDPLVHRHRPGRGREAPHRRRGRHRQRARERLLLPADDLRATSSPGCASRRRRSSARRRRSSP